MRKIFLLLITIYYLSLTISFAEPLSSRELIENAKDHNNQFIEYQGEAVGDMMRRGDFAWVNLHDGKNAVGVWLKKGQAAIIRYKGDYKFKGDIISVKGIFHRACPQHGGDLDMHAEEVIKVSDGCSVAHPIKKFDVANTIGLFIIAAGVFVLVRFKAKR